jgi:hypothetical protein
MLRIHCKNTVAHHCHHTVHEFIFLSPSLSRTPTDTTTATEAKKNRAPAASERGEVEREKWIHEQCRDGCYGVLAVESGAPGALPKAPIVLALIPNREQAMPFSMDLET